MKKMLHYLFALTPLIVGPLEATNQELLKSDDVSKVMKEMFEEHLDKKQMSDALLKKAFSVYLEQFDTEKFYLLQSEVTPLIEPDKTALQEDLAEYQKGDFSDFETLNQVIQKSILRARDYRKTLEGQEETLFKEALNFKPPKYEPASRFEYAKTLQELQKRQQEDILKFILVQTRRFGVSAVMEKKDHVLAMYEREIRDHENHYLFVDEKGNPLDKEHREHQFVLSILKALAKSLDAHSSYFNNAEAYDMRVRLEKDYVGVGITFQESLDGFTIASILKDGPADKSKTLKVGDTVISIDGKLVENMTLPELSEMARGDEGSIVNLTIKRKAAPGSNQPVQTINVKLKREKIEMQEDRVQSSYETFANGIIGKITLNSFYQNDKGISSENDVRNAIEKLKKEGHLLGLILDLRENSGGYLSQAVKVAGLFITNGVIVVSKYSDGEKTYYRDLDGKTAFDGPLIVLTSRLTASAAEIVAQALQDYGVALVVGDAHTYGKGSIQTQTVTDNKSSSYFKVTVGQYYTVSGKSPQLKGVLADVVVPSRFVTEDIGEEYLEYPIAGGKIDAAFDDTLADVAPDSKSWYLKYYLPHLQHPTQEWRKMIPLLKENSQYRIAHNKNYQFFLKQIGAIAPTKQGEEAEQSDSEEDEFSERKQKDYGAEDLQMQEATNVLKDMIMIHADMDKAFIGAPH